jgi:hypothetical protein
MKWLKNLKLRLKPTEKIFKEIYIQNTWESESRSGPGSEISQTEELVKRLPEVFNSFNIKTVLDAPCGDFNWMKEINLVDLDYLGGDIVNDIIQQNKQRYGSHNIKFETLNIITDTLPNVDLIITRDCLVHFSYKHIYQTIDNIKKSKSIYFASTTFANRITNYDIPTGEWRPLNLQIPPFNFPEPLISINEKCTEGNGQFSDKTLAIWKINDL